ncbi:MAG: potassium channel family protein, partial [Chloroflexota bacterium]|nr:potassium channel family protein [Chloroflexota bacterium]
LARLVPAGLRRHAFLKAGLPLLVAGLIGLWLLALLAGFALLYYPWIGDPAHFATPAGGGGAAAAALYFSGVTLFTIGYGEIQPIAGPFRALAVAEAAAGVLTVAFSVAYVLAVYPALARQRAVAIALDAEVAGQAGGLPLVRRYLARDGRWHAQLEERLRELGLELLALTESHETHPVLYYAHPRRVQHSFLRMLVTVQGLVGLLRYGLAPERHAEVVQNPQLLLLEQALGYSLRRLTASLHTPPVAREIDAAARRRLAAEYRALCADLEQLGLVPACREADRPVPVLVEPSAVAGVGPPRAGDAPAGDVVTYQGTPELLDPALDFASDSPVAAYITFRLETDPYLAAYAEASGYSLAQAAGTDETGWWVGGR